MAGEQDISKPGDQVKLDRTERTSESAVDDSVIAGDRKHDHQQRHQEMEKAGQNFQSWTTRSIPEKLQSETDEEYRTRLEKLAQDSNPLVFTDGDEVLYNAGSNLQQTLKKLQQSREESKGEDDSQFHSPDQHLASNTAPDAPNSDKSNDPLNRPGPESHDRTNPESAQGLENLESSQHLETLAATNPALQPVSLLRDYAHKLPPGEEKDRLTALSRQQATEVSPEMKAYYGQKSAPAYESGTHSALTPDMQVQHTERAESTDTQVSSGPAEFDQQPPGRAEKTGDSYKLKIDVSENVVISDNAESEADQQNLRNATRTILDTAKERFGKDGIEQLGIASDDVGSSMTALLLGPDLFKSMGPVEARNYGNRLMVFGLAPLFGMAQEAHKELVENTSETIKEGQVNFLAGTGLGIMLERAHPLLLAGLTIGFTGQFVTDQFCSPENKQRNTEILDISSKLDNIGSDDLARYCRRSKELLGPDLFKGAFGMATGGIGIPKGQIIAAETKAETAAITSKIKPGDVLDNLSQLPREACDALAWLFGHDGGPKLAWAHSGHGEMPVQKPALDSTDNLAMAGGNHFEWIKYLGKPALNPNLKLSKAVEMAIEKMVSIPKEDLKKLSEKFPDTKELAGHLKDRQEHFDSLTRVLSQLSEPRDLLTLYEKGHKFHFADLEDVAKGWLGKPAGIPDAPHTRVEELPGLTIFDRNILGQKKGETIVPHRIFDSEKGDWIKLKDATTISIDGTDSHIRVAGVLRHEIGQALSEVFKWKEATVVHPDGRTISANSLYLQGRRQLQHRHAEFTKQIDDSVSKLSDLGLSEDRIKLKPQYKSLERQRRIFDGHKAGSEIGFEQTLADLWAIHEGGSSHSPELDQELLKVFRPLYEFMVENNWFRR